MEILECEDGNSFSGDGCSEFCEIEEGFECSRGNETSPGSCSPTLGPECVILTLDETLLITVVCERNVTLLQDLNSLLEYDLIGPSSPYQVIFEPHPYLIGESFNSFTV